MRCHPDVSACNGTTCTGTCVHLASNARTSGWTSQPNACGRCAPTTIAAAPTSSATYAMTAAGAPARALRVIAGMGRSSAPYSAWMAASAGVRSAS